MMNERASSCYDHSVPCFLTILYVSKSEQPNLELRVGNVEVL